MLKRYTPIKRTTPLRKVSKKRAKESRIYAKKRKAFLEANKICQIYLDEHSKSIMYAMIMDGDAVIPAKYRSTDIHHKAGRTGTNYLDETTWLAVCRESHERIHNNPSWARERGYLV